MSDVWYSGPQVLVARIIDSYIDGIYDVYVVLNGIYCPLLSNDRL